MFKNRTLLGNRSKKVTIKRKNLISSSNSLKEKLLAHKLPNELISSLIYEAESFPAFHNMDIDLYFQVLMFLLNNIDKDLSELLNVKNITNYVTTLIPADKNDSSEYNQDLLTNRYIVEFFYYVTYVINQRGKNNEMEKLLQNIQIS